MLRVGTVFVLLRGCRSSIREVISAPFLTRASTSSIGAMSLGLSEGLGGHLVQDLELADLEVHEFLTIALRRDLRRLLDPVEILVVAESRLLCEIFAPSKSGDFGHQLDGQAALLVEVEREVLALGPVTLMPAAGLSPTFSSAAGSILKPFPFSCTSVVGMAWMLIPCFSLMMSSASISRALSLNFRQPLSPLKTVTPLTSLSPNLPSNSERIVIEPLERRVGTDLIIGAIECDCALRLPGVRPGLGELFLAAQGLDAPVDDGIRVLVFGPQPDRQDWTSGTPRPTHTGTVS